MQVTTTATVKAEGARHAHHALSQGEEFGTVSDTIQAYRENLIDTFNDEGLAEWVWVAVGAYDNVVQAMTE
jgi:hypothetical protein